MFVTSYFISFKNLIISRSRSAGAFSQNLMRFYYIHHISCHKELIHFLIGEGFEVKFIMKAYTYSKIGGNGFE